MTDLQQLKDLEAGAESSIVSEQLRAILSIVLLIQKWIFSRESWVDNNNIWIDLSWSEDVASVTRDMLVRASVLPCSALVSWHANDIQNTDSLYQLQSATALRHTSYHHHSSPPITLDQPQQLSDNHQHNNKNTPVLYTKPRHPQYPSSWFYILEFVVCWNNSSTRVFVMQNLTEISNVFIRRERCKKSSLKQKER